MLLLLLLRQVPLDIVDLSHVSILYTQGDMAAITPIYDYNFQAGPGLAPLLACMDVSADPLYLSSHHDALAQGLCLHLSTDGCAQCLVRRACKQSPRTGRPQHGIMGSLIAFP